MERGREGERWAAVGRLGRGREDGGGWREGGREDGTEEEGVWREGGRVRFEGRRRGVGGREKGGR